MTDANEITKETLKHILDSLKGQEGNERLKTSESLGKLKDYVDENQKSDPFITPLDKKANPWNEKGKCIIT